MPMDEEVRAKFQEMDDQIRRQKDELTVLRNLVNERDSQGMDRLTTERLEQHRILSPDAVSYWLTREAGGNAAFLTAPPVTATWSDA